MIFLFAHAQERVSRDFISNQRDDFIHFLLLKYKPQSSEFLEVRRLHYSRHIFLEAQMYLQLPQGKLHEEVGNSFGNIYGCYVLWL
jgi:hypothetical protein